MLQRLIAQRDPVITCDGEGLRFEGFSACCGVYARLDLLSSAFQAETMSPGTSKSLLKKPLFVSSGFFLIVS